MGSPPTGRQMQVGVGKNFYRPVEKSRAQTTYRQNLCPSATMVRNHDGALAEEYAVSSTTLVVVESDENRYGPVDINRSADDTQGIAYSLCDS